LAENLPIKIEFVDTSEKLDELLPKLEEMVGTGLIEVQDTQILKPAQAAVPPAGKPAAAQAGGPVSHLKRESKARLMRIYIRESDMWRDKPLYQALIESFRANDIAGATVYRGVMGYGAGRTIRRENPLGLTHDRPVMVSVVETEEKLRAMQPVLDDMIAEGLIAVSDVDIIKYSHRPPSTGDKEGGS
jgi:PII-like signaling protein